MTKREQNDITCSVILRRLFSRVILRPKAEGSVSPVSPVSPPLPHPPHKNPPLLHAGVQQTGPKRGTVKTGPVPWKNPRKNPAGVGNLLKKPPSKG